MTSKLKANKTEEENKTRRGFFKLSKIAKRLLKSATWENESLRFESCKNVSDFCTWQLDFWYFDEKLNGKKAIKLEQTALYIFM